MIIVRWILIAGLFLIISHYVPGISVASFYTALVLAFFWGAVGVLLRPVLVVLTLPINILTLGLFLFVINGFLFWLLSTFVKGFAVDGFGYAILGAALLSLGGWVINSLLESGKKHRDA